jgi:DNA polymerase-3 subunit gamma/tau
MSAEVLYRKWRPRAFAELAGQDALVRTLTNAVRSGKVSHAYLFSGPRGTGKTTTGRLLAKAVNCAAPQDGEPCNQCPTCLAFIESRAFDWLIELDAASNRGIDEIRSLRDKAAFAPASAGEVVARKVYLIDEVHMLTEPAFNALLKTLEEPPAHVIFVLATTDAHKVPATVVSRCQRFDFRRIGVTAMVERLATIAGAEGFHVATEALELIARTATGSLRDAINLLEQLVDSYGKEITLETAEAGLGLVIDPRSAELALRAVQGDLAEGLALISSVRDDGLDLRQFQRQVVGQLRGLLLAKAGAEDSDAWNADQAAELAKAVANVPIARVVTALRAFGEVDLRSDPLSSLPLEIALADTVLAGQPAGDEPVRRAAAPPPAARNATRDAPRAGPSASSSTPQANGRPAHNTEVASPSSAPSSSPGDVRERWQEIYQRARELHYRVGALLNSGCGIVAAGDGEIVFGFRHELMLDKMQGDAENMRALQQAVDDVLGPGIAVRCVQDAQVDIQRPARGGHLVRAAEELGGEIVADGD